MRERARLQREVKLHVLNERWMRHKWMKTYHLLLTSALKSYKLQHFSKIVLAQAAIFTAFSIILFGVLQEFVFSVGISFVFVYVLPISALFFIHKRKEKEIQDSLVETAVRLLQEYEKNNHNMLFALKHTVEQLDGASEIVFSKMFARMHDDPKTKILAAEALAFQIGHFRGKNLANIILRGCQEGLNVSVLLEHLVEDITGFNKRIRDAETEARETALIGYFILPGLIALYFVNDIWLIPDGNTAYYQFQTAQGLKSFLIAFVFGVIGIGLAIIVKKPKKT